MKALLVRIWVACLCIATSGIALADGAIAYQQLTINEEASVLTSAERSRVAEVRSNPTTRRAAVFTFDRNALNGNIVNITTPSGETLSFTKEKSQTTEVRELKLGVLPVSHQVFGWTGRSANGGEAHFSVDGDSVIGSVNTPGYGMLEISSISKAHHIISEFDATKRMERSDDVDTGNKK